MKNKTKGFTFVEAVIVTTIAVFIMLAVQQLFSHAVRSSLKGQDNLETMRAAGRIFSELRKDLLEFKTISTASASYHVNLDQTTLTDNIQGSDIIQIERKNEVIIYSLYEEKGKKYIERASKKIGEQVRKKRFGVPRMQSFDIVYLKVDNKSGKGLEKSGQIIVNLVIQSENKTFASKKLKVSTSYFPEKLQETDWNYLAF